jgi:hypothetical protein
MRGSYLATSLEQLWTEQFKDFRWKTRDWQAVSEQLDLEQKALERLPKRRAFEAGDEILPETPLHDELKVSGRGEARKWDAGTTAYLRDPNQFLKNAA